MRLRGEEVVGGGVLMPVMLDVEDEQMIDDVVEEIGEAHCVGTNVKLSCHLRLHSFIILTSSLRSSQI